jgi:hypothetical protein
LTLQSEIDNKKNLFISLFLTHTQKLLLAL